MRSGEQEPSKETGITDETLNDLNQRVVDNLSKILADLGLGLYPAASYDTEVSNEPVSES